MKKLGIFVLSFAFGGCLALSAVAKVVFLPSDDSSIGLSGVNNVDCQSQNYQYTQANCAGALYDACPSNSSYYKECGPQGYKYTIQECEEQGKSPSPEDWHGYRQCL